MLTRRELVITSEFLNEHPEAVFVFGDNLVGAGTGGAAYLRHHPQSLGFITKKYPNNVDSSFFTPDTYQEIFDDQVELLIHFIENNPGKMLYVSKIGGNLANRYGIWEEIIHPQLPDRLRDYSNQVTFLWD